MAQNSYVKGALVRVKAVFTVGGTNTNAGAAVCTITKPDGTTSTPAVVNDSAGTYHADVDTTAGPRGVWQYYWTGTNPAQAAAYTTFWLDDPAVRDS